MNLTIHQGRSNRGTTWFVRKDGEYFGAFGYSFHPTNSGAAFARNHGSASVRVNVAIGKYRAIEALEIGRATRAAQAQKIARRWFRENDIRELIASAARAGVDVDAI